jgi:hypothetical protein
MACSRRPSSSRWPRGCGPAASEVLLATIGATSALYAVWDVASDVLFRHSNESDAAALAQLTHVPAGRLGCLLDPAVARRARLL